MSRIVLMLAIAAGCLIGCKNDLTRPAEPSLIGDYRGVYQYQELADTSSTSDEMWLMATDSQFVVVSIDSQFFEMRLDTRWTKPADRFACDVRSRYRIDSRVSIQYPDEAWGFTGIEGPFCPTQLFPVGDFFLHQTRDSVILIHDALYTGPTWRLVERKVLRLKEQ